MPKKIIKEQSDFIEKLKELNIEIKPADLKTLRSLDQVNLAYAEGVVRDLNAALILDNESFSAVLPRLAEELPKVEPSKVTKISRKKTGAASSLITITTTADNKNEGPLELYYGHDKNKHKMGGGVGAVRQLFQEHELKKPEYFTKKFNIDDAECEVQHLRLLDREAYLYESSSNKEGTERLHIISEWVQGEQLNPKKNLNQIKRLLNAPFDLRMRCLTNLISDINTLHSHNRMHGDPSAANSILNLDAGTLKLIDFGSSVKYGIPPTKEQPTNPSYEDPNHQYNGPHRDMYAIAKVGRMLFPEIFAIDMLERNLELLEESKKSKLTDPQKQAVQVLFRSMSNKNLKKRCTSLDALNFCEAINENSKTLDKAKVEELAASSIIRPRTLSHPLATYEDVLRKPDVWNRNSSEYISEYIIDITNSFEPQELRKHIEENSNRLLNLLKRDSQKLLSTLGQIQNDKAKALLDGIGLNIYEFYSRSFEQDNLLKELKDLETTFPNKQKQKMFQIAIVQILPKIFEQQRSDNLDFFTQIYQILPIERSEEICHAGKTAINKYLEANDPAIIASDFAKLLQSVGEKKAEVIFSAFAEDFISKIVSIDHYNSFISEFKLEPLKEKIPSFLDSAKHLETLNSILKQIPLDDCKKHLSSVKKAIQRIKPGENLSHYNVNSILSGLDENKAALIFNEIPDLISNRISTANEIHSFHERLEPEFIRNMLYNLIKNNLPAIINSTKDFNII